MTTQPTPEPSLTRTLGFWTLCIYGIGDILGAGIYALIDDVAGLAASFGWISFLLAMFVAGLTALSYCELVVRYPYSAGEANYVLHGFGRPRFAFLVGWMVFCSGLVSMSTATHACADYARALYPSLLDWSVWLVFLAVLTVLNLWGLRLSSRANIVFTAIELSGLLLVVGTGLWFLSGLPDGPERVAEWRPTNVWGVFRGASLAFFAYIGFEDMINVAEEVEQPERTFPKAILIALLVSGSVYIAVYLVATSVIPPEKLQHESAPLLAVIRVTASGIPPELFTIISLIAVANTALLNFIMASRLVYGMAKRSLLPSGLAEVHPRTRSPHRAILAVLAVAIVLVFSGTLRMLAATTSLLILVVFICVNLALLRLRFYEKDIESSFRIPLAIPWLACATSLVLLVFVEFRSWVLGAALIAAGGLISFYFTPREAGLENAGQS